MGRVDGKVPENSSCTFFFSSPIPDQHNMFHFVAAKGWVRNKGEGKKKNECGESSMTGRVAVNEVQSFHDPVIVRYAVTHHI